MAEVRGPSGSWAFDGDLLRIVLVPGRRTRTLAEARGDVEVPIAAIAGVAFTPGRQAQLRLRLRDGADPFLQVGGGQLSDLFDPYRLTIPPDSLGAAEYLVDEVRTCLTIEQVPAGPTDRYLVDGPAVPLTARADDGTAWFDGSRLRLEWSGWASPAKKSAGPQEISLEDVVGVEWAPMSGRRAGLLRLVVRDAPLRPAREDPTCLTWGVALQNRWGSFASVKTRAKAMGGTTSLLAAAVVARLPHPYANGAETSAPRALSGPPAAAGHGDQDALLRRLRELKAMLDQGILSTPEYEAAKRAVLRLL